MAVVYVHELDGEQLESSEDQLKGLGFISPEELLSGKYNIEAWAVVVTPELGIRTMRDLPHRLIQRFFCKDRELASYAL